MPKVDYIVCSQVADVSLVNAPHIVPGSLTANCSRCGEPVLVSPSALEIHHDNSDSQFLCLQCGLAGMKKDGGVAYDLIKHSVAPSGAFATPSLPERLLRERIRRKLAGDKAAYKMMSNVAHPPLGELTKYR